jgi:hypothetical protein
MTRTSSALWGVFPIVALAVAMSPLCSAQPVAHSVSAQDRAECQSFITERLSVWRKRLKLEDWNIKIILARSNDLRPKTVGNIHWDSETKEATIRVLDPADYQLTRDAMLKDMEFTVVHELIHLELTPLLSTVTRSEASRGKEEHTVNALADAILGN